MVTPSRASVELSETEKARESIKQHDIEDLDKGCRWAFKYHALFPLLATLRHADHYVRFIYPCSYALVIAMWSWSWSAGE